MEYSFLRVGVVEPETFAHEGKSFLERMRHSSSYELVQRVKTFVLTFTTMEGSPEDFSSYLQGFLEELSRLLTDHTQWREEGEKGLRDALEAMERYLLQRLYSTAFYIPTSTDSEDDEKFYHRVRTLQFLQPDHLDIKERRYNQTAFEMAARELSRLEEDVLKSPKEKMQCVINAVIIITNLLKQVNTEEGTGADDLLPYLISLLLLTSPKHIHSNLRYIRRFRRPSMLSSEEAYYLTHMESAIMFISTLDHTSLSISEEVFKRGVEECEHKIRTGKDIPKRFPRTISWDDTAISATNMTFKESNDSPSQSPSSNEITRKEKETIIQEQKGHSPNLTAEGMPVSLQDNSKIDVPNIPIGSSKTDTTPARQKDPSSLTACLVPKFFHTSFELLTVQELQQLHKCYQLLYKHVQEATPTSD